MFFSFGCVTSMSLQRSFWFNINFLTLYLRAISIEIERFKPEFACIVLPFHHIYALYVITYCQCRHIFAITNERDKKKKFIHPSSFEQWLSFLSGHFYRFVVSYFANIPYKESWIKPIYYYRRTHCDVFTNYKSNITFVCNINGNWNDEEVIRKETKKKRSRQS